ncbi:hypothetical protein RF11_10259 [Thelohanellus kitauei]|uniref:Uncharacterized protein n=1 Tax=Thelohanellus kitauei TaxID=669202 RepID=A0A0C2MXY1_THEKT|nr:hypothetical protein RF11_10259 [Thelohanellus kitauei]
MNFLIVEITLLFWRRKECSEPKFDLGVFEQSSRTRVDNCSYYREIATLKRSRNSSNHSLRICWAESIINLCKAKLGQQEYRRVRFVDGVWVLRAIERWIAHGKSVYLCSNLQTSNYTLYINFETD